MDGDGAPHAFNRRHRPRAILHRGRRGHRHQRAARLVVRRASDRDAARRSCPSSVDQPSPMRSARASSHRLKLQRSRQTWAILSASAVDGELYYIARASIRSRAPLNAPRHDVVALFADMARLNALYMIATRRVGPYRLVVLQHGYVRASAARARSIRPPGDLFFSSKGHDAPGLYAVMMAVGQLDRKPYSQLRRLGGLPGHPDVGTARHRRQHRLARHGHLEGEGLRARRAAEGQAASRSPSSPATASCRRARSGNRWSPPPTGGWARSP